MRQCLGDQHASLHAPGKFHHLRIALVPKRKIAQQLFDVGGIGPLSEKTPTEVYRCNHFFVHLGGHFLRHQANSGPRSLILADNVVRSEEHTSELQSLMRISYAVFCLKKKKIKINLNMINTQYTTTHRLTNN